jgi:AcrR family transcriptional regulator
MAGAAAGEAGVAVPTIYYTFGTKTALFGDALGAAIVGFDLLDAGSAWQVRNSTGPLNQCPDGQRIRTLSTGPPVERAVNRSQTSAGRPHRSAPSWSR